MIKAFRRLGGRILGYFRTLSLGRRFAFLYILAALLPLLVTNLYANSTLNSSAHSAQLTAAERGFEQTVAVMNDRLYRVLRMCDVIALDPALNDCLYTHDPKSYSLAEQMADMNAILTSLSQRQDDLDIYNINLYVQDQWIYSQRADVISSLSAAAEQGWYAELLATNHQTMFCPPDLVPEEGVLSCARRVRNLDNLNQVEAILRIDFPLGEIEQILNQGSVIEGSVSMILTQDGAPVASSQRPAPAIAQLEPLIATAGAFHGFQTLDERYLAQCAPLANSDWYLVTLLSRSAMTRASALARLGVALLILAAALPTVLLAQRILRGMTARLQRLGDHMLHVRLGDLKPTERDENRDEIGVMTDSYNYMIERMQTLLEEQYRIGQEARSAELLALQSQIKPHFLYNTLDMVTWMARKNQTDEIQTVIKALANFYRASLSRGKDIIRLRDELLLIENYMTIQHMRFGDNVTLHIDVPDDLLRCTLPKITLQPIVENALLHGIFPKEQKRGTITIRAQRQGAGVQVEIEDDGVGMPSERVGTMLFPVHPDKTEHGYGLYNIEKRLCLTFGISRCLSIRSSPGRGTRVRLLFPARFAPQEDQND